MKCALIPHLSYYFLVQLIYVFHFRSRYLLSPSIVLNTEDFWVIWFRLSHKRVKVDQFRAGYRAYYTGVGLGSMLQVFPLYFRPLKLKNIPFQVQVRLSSLNCTPEFTKIYLGFRQWIGIAITFFFLVWKIVNQNEFGQLVKIMFIQSYVNLSLI